MAPAGGFALRLSGDAALIGASEVVFNGTFALEINTTADVVELDGTLVGAGTQRLSGRGVTLTVANAATAMGDIVVFIDADGSHEPNDIPALVAPILAGQSDLVVGSRGKGGSDELHGTLEQLIRYIGSQIIMLGINYRWNVRLTDSQNGFRAIRRDVGRKLGLTSNLTTIEQEMMMKALKKGYRVSEIPSHEYERKWGTSKVVVWKLWFAYIWSFLRNLI